MNKKFVKFGILAAVGLYMGLAVASGSHVWKGSGLPAWMEHVRSDGFGHYTIDAKWLDLLGPRPAYGQNTGQGGAPAAPSAAPSIPGGPVGGAGPAPRRPLTGQTKVSAGSTTIVVPAAGWSPAVYTNCFASIENGGSTPVAGAQPACQVTSTATIIASATATVGAVNILLAGTPSPSPTISWMITQ